MNTPSAGERTRLAVAEEVRVLLTRRRLTGVKLAEMIGRSQVYVSRRLRGEVAFDADDLGLIADALNVEPVDLLPKPSSNSSNRGRYRPEQHVIATIGVDRPARIRRSTASPVSRPHIPGRAVAQTRPTSRVSL